MWSTQTLSHFQAPEHGSYCKIAVHLSTAYFLPPVCAVHALRPPAVHVQYMTHAVNIPAAYKRVGGQWDALLHNVAFPLMAFNDEDMRLWAEDPHEYIRKVGRQDVRIDACTDACTAGWCSVLGRQDVRTKPRANHARVYGMASG